MRRTDFEKWEGLTRKNEKVWVKKWEGLTSKSGKDWPEKWEGLTLNMECLSQNREDPIQKQVGVTPKEKVLLTPHNHRNYAYSRSMHFSTLPALIWDISQSQ